MRDLSTGMWWERYRPTTLDDCILDGLPREQQDWLRSLKQSNEQLPNILFYGPPGTGKTTVARILVENDKRFEFFICNALTDGKNIVEGLRSYISTVPFRGDHKVVLIDEVDEMPTQAREALRGLIEEYPASWIMTCNERGKLSHPLQSRLIRVEMSYAPRSRQGSHVEGLMRRCRQILAAEGIGNVQESELRGLVERDYPDMRQILSRLQITFGREVKSSERQKAAA
jgi:DNA polymerase III delta prime subunit